MSGLWAGRSAARHRGGPLSTASRSRMLVLGHNDRVSSFAFALFGLLFGSYFLSTRYYTSAAFERPYHFAFAALIIHAGILRVLQPWVTREARRATFKDGEFSLPLSEKDDARKSVLPPSPSLLASLRDPRKAPELWLLSVGVAMRCVATWYVIRAIQCSSIGLESFRVLYVYILDNSRIGQRWMGRPIETSSAENVWPRWKSATYLKFALSWALATTHALSYARIPSSAVCPNAWWYDPLVPILQIFICAIDAHLLVGFNNLRQRFLRHGRSHVSVLINVSLLGAASIVLLSIPSWAEDRNFFWALTFHYADVRDFLIDGLLTASALVCGSHLLAVLSPATVAFAATGMAMFGIHIPYLGISDVIPSLDMEGIQMKMAFAAFSATPMWLLLRPPRGNPRPAVTAVVHRWLLVCYAGIIALCLGFWLMARTTPVAQWSVAEAVDELTRMGRSYSTSWQAQASSSGSLEDAVTEYQKRYGIPPPPNFDKWYNYAIAHKSPIIDDFGQIHNDLLPFWGVAPSVIRAKTFEVQQYAAVEMVGLRIRNGAVDHSPHIHPSHQWMMTSIERMVGPFAQWLPDMDIAINVADEPRVAVTYQEKQRLESEARKARTRLQHGSNSHGSDKVSPTQWPSDFPKPLGGEGQMLLPQGFTNYIRKPILNDLVADSCPPNSPLHRSRWWDSGTTCTQCQIPHSLITKSGALMLNATRSSDLCHQPDMAYLTGAVSSPSAMFATRQLSPVFSQGRITGFSDILMPSPWNFDERSSYNDAEDIDWSAKTNSIFWRGGSTDGYAAEGSWTGFTRARFGKEAFEKATELNRQGPAPGKLGVNVSFSGEMTRCHKSDCRAELQTFNLWATAAAGSEATSQKHSVSSNHLLPPVVPFSEHWRFRHLIDMDGAGFSGRFLPFLRSRSLVYRASLYRTWMDERVHAWQHYIPVDVRFGQGFWHLVEYLAGAGQKGSGDSTARMVAEQGRRWAGEALRKEDMQVYMFRLLLEWGRIVDDDRENLFYKA
ncbi:hypothetical protein NLU13_4304 [Sarocladium strictum]|uniref:Glycosyl transferase CAP10 domain-containing protein n=1 Tax=Sarocladium strictum TaxID=5046 RepID=A0AA39GIL7_SARSR|nr:hypothetical protein NLU13_4304 [Sarocladium strictum]